MRRFILTAGAVVAAAVGSMAMSTASMAGGDSDWVCWMQPIGVTACGWVKDPYHVRDVQWKPHRHKNVQKCRHCSVDFSLTHANISDLGHHVDNSTMRRFHDATLYGDKYRGPYNHE